METSCASLLAKREEGIDLVLAEAEDAADLAVGRTPVIMKSTGEVLLLRLRQIAETFQLVLFPNNLPHLCKQFSISQELSIIQLRRQLAVRLHVLRQQCEVVVRVAEHRHAELDCAEGGGGDVAVDDLEVRRHAGSVTFKQRSQLSCGVVADRIDARNVIVIVSSSTPRIRKRREGRVYDITIAVDVDDCVPQRSQVCNFFESWLEGIGEWSAPIARIPGKTPSE